MSDQANKGHASDLDLSGQADILGSLITIYDSGKNCLSWHRINIKAVYCRRTKANNLWFDAENGVHAVVPWVTTKEEGPAIHVSVRAKLPCYEYSWRVCEKGNLIKKN